MIDPQSRAIYKYRFGREAIGIKAPSVLAPLNKDTRNIMTSKDILSSETLTKAGNLEIFDENRTKVKFSSFYTEKQTLVIFIRHFMCGNCMVAPCRPVSYLIYRHM